MADETSRSTLICRIIYSTLGVVVGIVIFFLWLLYFNTSEASMHTVAIGGLSGVIAAWNLVTHLMHLQDYWRTWLKGLKWFITFGVVFMVLSTAGFVAYLVYSITKNTEFVVDSFYVTSIFCLLTFKWSFLLFWHSKSYRNEFADLTALLEFWSETH